MLQIAGSIAGPLNSSDHARVYVGLGFVFGGSGVVAVTVLPVLLSFEQELVKTTSAGKMRALVIIFENIILINIIGALM